MSLQHRRARGCDIRSRQGRPTLQLLVGNAADLDVRLPSRTEVVTRVLLHADEPRAFLDEVSRYEVTA
jgi:hypothetical protein